MNGTSDFQINKKYKTGMPRTSSHHIKGKVLRSCFFSIFKYNSIWIYVIFKLIHISSAFFLQNHQDMKIVLIYIVFSLHAWSSQGGTGVFKVILFYRNTLTGESVNWLWRGKSLCFILLSSLLLLLVLSFFTKLIHKNPINTHLIPRVVINGTVTTLVCLSSL